MGNKFKLGDLVAFRETFAKEGRVDARLANSDFIITFVPAEAVLIVIEAPKPSGDAITLLTPAGELIVVGTHSMRGVN